MASTASLIFASFLPHPIQVVFQLGDHALKSLDCGQLTPRRCRKLTSHTEGRNADRLGNVAQRILNDSAIVSLAEQETNGRGIRFHPEKIVHGRELEAQFPCPLRLEFASLQLDDEVAA